MRSLALLLFAMTASAASACDCVTFDPRSPHYERDLAAVATYYPVAADGRLEKAGPLLWRFVPEQELRGTGQKSYEVGVWTDCALDPQTLDGLVGKRVFLLLSRLSGPGPARYEAGRCVNALEPDVEKALRGRMTACAKR